MGGAAALAAIAAAPAALEEAAAEGGDGALASPACIGMLLLVWLALVCMLCDAIVCVSCGAAVVGGSGCGCGCGSSGCDCACSPVPSTPRVRSSPSMLMRYECERSAVGRVGTRYSCKGRGVRQAQADVNLWTRPLSLALLRVTRSCPLLPPSPLHPAWHAQCVANRLLQVDE